KWRGLRLILVRLGFTKSRTAGGHMAQAREAMIAELKRGAVPVLQSLGFKGSFPHFRREMDTQIDLLSFQFSMSGGQVVVENGKFPANADTVCSALLPPWQ